MKLSEISIDLAVDGGLMRCRMMDTLPQRDRPALVLYSEIFQLTGPVLRLARFYAGHGYRVYVPEVYWRRLPIGTVLGYDDAGRDLGNSLKPLTPMADYDLGLAAILEHARNDGLDRFGAIGYCLGGHLSFRAALSPEISASVCFYGTDLHGASLGPAGQCDTLARCSEIQGSMLMIWGRQDPHIPLEGRRTVQAALEAAGTDYEWHEFNASHAFGRDEGERHDPEISRSSHGLALDFLARHLKF